MSRRDEKHFLLPSGGTVFTGGTAVGLAPASPLGEKMPEGQMRGSQRQILWMREPLIRSCGPPSPQGEKRERAAPFTPNLRRVYSVLDEEVRQAST
jgi:hypothetical protein